MESPYDPPRSKVDDGNVPASFLARQSRLRLFQSLVVASVITYVVWFLLPLVPLPLSPELQALRDWNGYGALFPQVADLVAWLLFALWLLASAGLYFIQLWARTLFAVLYAVAFLWRFAEGVSVSLPIDFIFLQLTTLFDGAILVLAFTEPLDAYFKRQAA